MNQESGANNKAALTSEIETAFTAHGWQVEFVLAGRRDLRSRTEQTVAQAPGTIVVAGGDGTINTVASACVAAKRPLGWCLPGHSTMSPAIWECQLRCLRQYR